MALAVFAEATGRRLFGDFGRRDAGSPKKRFPKVRQMRGTKAAVSEMVRAGRGKVVTVKGEEDLRHFFLLRAMISDLGLELPVIEPALDRA